MIARVVPWLLAASFALGCALLIRRALRVESDAARVTEASRLVAQGQIVAASKDRDGIRADLDAAIGENAQLKEELATARKASPGAKVVRTVSASTGPMIAGGVARECPVPPTVPGCACPPSPPCLVAPGDSIEVRVQEVDLQTKLGNRVIVGTGECLRIIPAPETILAQGPFESRLTSVSELAPPPDTSWPWYAHAAIGAGAGLVAGVMIAK